MANQKPEPVGQMDSDGRWRKTKRVWIPEIDTDARAEIERLRTELRLEDRAADDGHKNEPRHSDTSLNEIQLAVCSHVHSGILMLNQFLNQQVGLAVQRARELLPTTLDANRVRAQAGRTVDRLFDEHRPFLVEKRRSDLEKARDLKLFVHRNALGRAAQYEDSVIKVAGIITGLFVLESVINGSLFAQVVANGLFGGAILAGMISAINIVSGIFAGLWGWRNIGHRKSVLKALGTAVTLLLHTVAMYWNLFVAHFREVAEDLAFRDTFEFDVSQLRDATTNHIQTHGLLGIESLQSWALLLLGIFIHFIATKEGWDDFADRYPDYKKYDLRAKLAHEEYEDSMAELRQEVRDAVEDIEEQAKTAVSEAKAAHQSIAELLDVALERQEEVRDSEREWVSGGNRLLKSYREINVKIRDERTVPSYFSVYPAASDYRANRFGETPFSTEVDESARCVEKSLGELRELCTAAKTVEEKAEEVLRDIHRHISRAMKEVDTRLEKESLKMTETAKDLLENDGVVQSWTPPTLNDPGAAKLGEHA